MATATKPRARRTTRKRKPGELPSLDRTLGPIAVRWIESQLCHGPGDVQGTEIELDDEFVRFLLRAYELDDRGRRMIRRAFFSRPKGRAKSEFAAMICAFEALGPCRFGGWDESGRPVGQPVVAPRIPFVATEEGQASDGYAAVEFMLREGAVSRTPGLDVGLTRTYLPGGGWIRPVTAKATSKDGGKESFVVYDETHLYVPAELIRLHQTLRRNLTKRKAAEPWALEVSTMYGVDEGSVAESSHAYAQAIAEGQITDPTFLFDHRSGPDQFDFANDAELRAALEMAYGEAAAWTDFERMILEARDPQTRESDFRRYFVNVPTKREDAWIPAGAWGKLAKKRKVEDGEEIAIGFDGSERRDATGLVGCTMDGHLFVIDAWERPETAKDWRVPRGEVDAAVGRAFDRWKVAAFVADPWGWQEELERWGAEFPVVISFPMKPSKQAPPCSKFFEQVMDGLISHDGDARLARHVGNAVRRDLREGFFIEKPGGKDSRRTIDLAVAAILALWGTEQKAAVADAWAPFEVEA